jgi:heme/copper-type cytochrome/quinol oxidase subunit 3
MWLFLAALFMLFAAGLLGYVIIRLQAARQKSYPLGVVRLPPLLWLSTAAVVGVSVALARARSAFRRARQLAYRNALTASLALAVGFITLQTPALANLLSKNAATLRAATQSTTQPTGTALYALLFFLVLVHALHVVGGILWLSRLALHAHRGTYDPRDPTPLHVTTLYWHFLDAVWIVMFLTIRLLG